jgi:hypothetical protein
MYLNHLSLSSFLDAFTLLNFAAKSINFSRYDSLLEA